MSAPGFEVTDVERMSTILEVISFLDEICWECEQFDWINYFQDDLSSEERLLTHLLCYITNRQMPFERIWDIGGYVLSHLVHTYTTNPKKKVWEGILEPYIRRKRGVLRLECPLESPNDLLADYGITEGVVPFASRYMSADLILIYRTLAILDKVAKRSLGRFLAEALGEERDLERGIMRLAVALDKLTYSGGRLAKKANLMEMKRKTEREVAGFELDVHGKVPQKGRKRLWCTLQDWLKATAYNSLFMDSLKKAGYRRYKAWERESPDLKRALAVLELPGDVWNNKPIFKDGLFTPYISGTSNSWDMPRIIREIYNFLNAQGIEMTFYPEQLDISFYFVRHMCEENMCVVCPFGKGIKKTCHQTPRHICPVIYYSCGFKYRCRPSSCALIDDAAAGLCKSGEKLIKKMSDNNKNIGS